MFTLCEHYRPVITRLQVRTLILKAVRNGGFFRCAKSHLIRDLNTEKQALAAAQNGLLHEE